MGAHRRKSQLVGQLHEIARSEGIVVVVQDKLHLQILYFLDDGIAFRSKLCFHLLDGYTRKEEFARLSFQFPKFAAVAETTLHKFGQALVERSSGDGLSIVVHLHEKFAAFDDHRHEDLVLHVDFGQCDAVGVAAKGKTAVDDNAGVEVDGVGGLLGVALGA